ncbi:MAG: Glycosyl transferase group 1 [Microgenomates group bacterium GW2011_GWC1_37_8]|uniref:Glycosyl transferase group 1 n=1 Tax=Candidatus Woesebacteria bacterium GW2011_GWB1_38_8 TaxID=1618570 RepID=A0A0G0PA25_9BACT|nr:MAG: Glycosyl transferase group 1 [Microgenomates group bacterium GW2011_GWC1_37_8]KKQ86136.1 MAG: Glycosyl transferase group 1 [Candidatus Woesebacteria bacterium GW2011_GWB1_38_8]
MKIAIDFSSIIYGTGVSVYTRNLIRSLLKLDKINQYLLFAGSLRRQKELKEFLNTLRGENLQGRVFPIPPSLADILWNKIHILSVEQLIGNINVFHSSDWTQPPSAAFKVTTIHDLVPIKYPNMSDPKIVSAHTRRLYWVKREVDRVIVPSQATKDDLVRLDINNQRIRVIPEAPDDSIKRVDKDKVGSLKRKYRISGGYLLAIGVSPRKNIERIVQAFEKIKSGSGLKLVVIGHPYSKISPKRGVVYLGHVPQPELPIFYSGARALIYPSLYEGFGLPILEAFRCRTPVVTSNLGSMAEVAGNAAQLVDPYDVESISDGIRKVVASSQLFVKKGTSRVKKFSWEKTAGDTLKVYYESQNK